jgi:hypothetical protein
MSAEKREQEIFNEARRYLLSFSDINDEVLNEHLDEWKNTKLNSIRDVFYGILNAVKNRQGMPNAIGEIDRLRKVLFDFSPIDVVDTYDNHWDKVFSRISKECNPRGRMVISNPRNYWVIFCKSIISASDFLSRFSDLVEFDDFVKAFYLNEYTRVALPLLLEKEIFGMGFALACDFLKENGYPEFVKPDVHIKTIFKGIGLSETEEDYEVFKDVVRFSKAINELPYRVDKMFWLVGSGNFYLYNIKIQTNRDQFIRNMKRDLAVR